MKRLIIIFAIVSICGVGFARAGEHSEMSNAFTLDTRDTMPSGGLEHSALSNAFTLDTRDAALPAGLEHSALSDGFVLDTRDLKTDVDGDGTVGISDLVLVATAFGASGQDLPADVNRDGFVNLIDLIMVARAIENARD